MIALNLVAGYQSGWRYGLRGFLAFVPFWLFAAAFALFGRCSIVVDDTVIANASSDTHGKKFAGAN